MTLASFFAVIATERGYQAVSALRLDESGFWHGFTVNESITFVEEQVLAKFPDAETATIAMKRAQDTERGFREIWGKAISLANQIERDMRAATLQTLLIGSIQDD